MPINSCCAEAGDSIDPTSIKMSIRIAIAKQMFPKDLQYEKLIGPSLFDMRGKRSLALPQLNVPQSMITPPNVVP